MGPGESQHRNSENMWTQKCPQSNLEVKPMTFFVWGSRVVNSVTASPWLEATVLHNLLKNFLKFPSTAPQHCTGKSISPKLLCWCILRLFCSGNLSHDKNVLWLFLRSQQLLVSKNVVMVKYWKSPKHEARCVYFNDKKWKPWSFPKSLTKEHLLPQKCCTLWPLHLHQAAASNLDVVQEPLLLIR